MTAIVATMPHFHLRKSTAKPRAQAAVPPCRIGAVAVAAGVAEGRRRRGLREEQRGREAQEEEEVPAGETG